MLIKAGVDISRLKRMIRKALSIAERVINKHSIEFVVTSTYEGNHSAGSLHYCDEAFDCRSIEPFGVRVLISEEIVEEIKKKLGPDFDVVLEYNHLHIEYDPK